MNVKPQGFKKSLIHSNHPSSVYNVQTNESARVGKVLECTAAGLGPGGPQLVAMDMYSEAEIRRGIVGPKGEGA